MKKTEDFIKEMQGNDMLMSGEYTFKEYSSDLLQFQDIICKMIAGDNYHEGMRMNEALFMMESVARKKGLRSDPAVHNGVLTMKKLVKEMAITMSGAKGESIVFRTLDFLDRPNTHIFRNVYLTDGMDETELDGIVLTNSGVIILEVKKAKSDLTLTKEGRMMFAGEESYGKAPLAEKMRLKRHLLRKYLEKAISAKALDIPVCVDSLIVFSVPKGQFIKVDDRYGHEKHCFRTGLNKKVESYIGGVCYDEEQLSQLRQIFSEMESNVKRFAPNLDYDEVRRSLAEALVVLQDASVKQETRAAVTEKTTVKQVSPKVIERSASNATCQYTKRTTKGFGRTAACVVAGLLFIGAAAVACDV